MYDLEIFILSIFSLIGILTNCGMLFLNCFILSLLFTSVCAANCKVGVNRNPANDGNGNYHVLTIKSANDKESEKEVKRSIQVMNETSETLRDIKALIPHNDVKNTTEDNNNILKEKKELLELKELVQDKLDIIYEIENTKNIEEIIIQVPLLKSDEELRKEESELRNKKQEKLK